MCIFPQIWIWWIWVFDHSLNRTFLFEVMGIKAINDSPPTFIPMTSNGDQSINLTTNIQHIHFAQVSTTKTEKKQLWIYQRDRTQATGLLVKTEWLRSETLMLWAPVEVSLSNNTGSFTAHSEVFYIWNTNNIACGTQGTIHIKHVPKTSDRL